MFNFETLGRLGFRSCIHLGELRSTLCIHVILRLETIFYGSLTNVEF